MYYDDPYDPTLENDYDVPESVQSDSITVDSRIKKHRKLLEDFKNEDKGYCKIKVNYADVELYSGSICPGSRIRGAITGTKFDQYKVGTKDEYMFFKVSVATGAKGLRGNTIFYFDNPEQYERHMKCTLDTVTKGRWAERNTAERMRRKDFEN
uniref:Uncharacterized protein n=1 Tax=viral metagenome TaxID=1070528 RepID=A0A6C0B7F8_9ZZZZ